MSNDSNYNGSGNSSSTATAEHSNSLRDKVEAKKHTTHAAVDQDWVIQKLRERHMSFNELTRLAKEENFKPASVRTVLTQLQDANLVRVTDGEHYEIV